MMDSELLSRTKEHRDHVTWDVRPTETLLISCMQIFPPVRTLLVLIIHALSRRYIYVYSIYNLSEVPSIHCGLYLLIGTHIGTFKPERGSSVMKTPSQKSIAAFKAKVDAIMKTQKVKKTAKQEKKKVERAAQEESSRQSIKRVQTYLGIRPPSLAQHSEAIRARLQKENLQWEEYDEAFRDAMTNLPPPKAFDTEKPIPHDQEESVVFVCVDVEAYERNTHQITEIGIATLDTKDLESLNSGDGGVNWWQMIRARHFRINEYKHLNNTEFVDGCADRFEFGYSQSWMRRVSLH